MPPFSYENLDKQEHVERSIISGLVQSPHMLLSVKETISQEMFQSEANGVAFLMVCDAIERGVVPDLLLIGKAVSQAIGMSHDYAVEWLKDLTENTTYHGENSDYYAGLLLEGYRRRALAAICDTASRAAREPGKPVEETLASAETSIAGLITGVKRSTVVPVSKSIIETLDIIGSGGAKFTQTGISTIDDIIGGFCGQQLIIVGGRPGMGKSALMLNIAQNMAEAGTPVLFFSREMSEFELNCRMIARVANLHLGIVRRPFEKKMRSEICDAGNKIGYLPIYIDDKTASIIDIVSAIRYSKRTYKIGAAFVDYIGIVGASDKRAPREQQIADITNRLKGVAKELDIPIIAASQLNRMVEHRENKRPQLSDLRESGAAEQDADIVMFTHREGYYDATKPPDAGEVIIAKHRQGQSGIARVHWEGTTTTFRAALPQVQEVDFGDTGSYRYNDETGI